MLPQLRTTFSTVYCSCSAMFCVWAFGDVRKSPESWQYRGSRKIGFGWATAVTRKSLLLIRQISHTQLNSIISSDFPVFPVSVEKQELLLSKGHAATIEDLKVFQLSAIVVYIADMDVMAVLKGAAAKERNRDPRGSRGEERRHVGDSLYHMSMRANSTLRTQSGRTCTGTHLIE